MAILTRPDRLTTITTLPAGMRGLGADIRRIDISQENIAPSPQSWVTPDDVLEVFTQSSLAGVSIQVVGRVLLYDGTVTMYGGNFQSNATRVLVATFFPLHYGFMLGATCYTFGAVVPQRGQLLADLVLARSPISAVQIHYGLGMDYLTRLNQINWPFSRITTGVEGPGALLTVTGTAPAAGADFSQAVPTNARWRVRTVFAQLTTSAAVANRTPTLIIDDGATTQAALDTTAIQAASLARQWYWISGSPKTGVQTVFDNEFLMPDLILRAGSRIRSATNGLDVGDQWTAPTFHVEEWLDG